MASIPDILRQEPQDDSGLATLISLVYPLKEDNFAVGDGLYYDKETQAASPKDEQTSLSRVQVNPDGPQNAEQADKEEKRELRFKKKSK